MDQADKNDLGRRLLAALLSYQLGNTSIDYTLKKYVPQDVSPKWADLGEALLRQLNGVPGPTLAPPRKPN